MMKKYCLPILFGVIVLAYFQQADALTKKEPYIVPIETSLYKGAFVHTYNVCAGSNSLNSAVILVYSKSAATIEKINQQIRPGLCDTFDTRIMAVDPNTIQAKLIKSKDVAKTVKILESKTKSIQTKISELENAFIVDKNNKQINMLKVLKSNLDLTNNKLRALKII